tara:strand:- start:1485 stop:1685 length:201 start_codon:yes stop_codon:yes gene_type:complete
MDDMLLEISMSALSLNAVPFACGKFGKVFKGTYDHAPVVVKKLTLYKNKDYAAMVKRVHKEVLCLR